MGTGSIEITEATVVEDDLVDAMARLVPQLSSSGSPPDTEALEAIVASDSVVLLVAVSEHVIVGALALVLGPGPMALVPGPGPLVPGPWSNPENGNFFNFLFLGFKILGSGGRW